LFEGVNRFIISYYSSYQYKIFNYTLDICLNIASDMPAYDSELLA